MYVHDVKNLKLLNHINGNILHVTMFVDVKALSSLKNEKKKERLC